MEKAGEKKICRNCGSTRNVKWGKRRGKQCYRCGDCGFQFTREDGRKSEKTILQAVALYCCGFSFKTIGMILYYHDTTIMRWIGEFADKHCQKPVSKGEVLIELDEMRRFVASKKAQLEFEKHAEEQAERFLSGNAKIEIPRLLQDCIVD